MKLQNADNFALTSSVHRELLSGTNEGSNSQLFTIVIWLAFDTNYFHQPEITGITGQACSCLRYYFTFDVSNDQGVLDVAKLQRYEVAQLSILELGIFLCLFGHFGTSQTINISRRKMISPDFQPQKVAVSLLKNLNHGAMMISSISDQNLQYLPWC